MSGLRKYKQKLILFVATFLLMIMAGFTCVYINMINAETNDEYIKSVKSALNSIGYNNIPLNADNVPKSNYSINNQSDWMALMVLSYESDLKGITFTIKNDDSSTGVYKYDLRNISINGKNFSFKGIGLNSAHPFKGSLINSWSSLEIDLSSPLFGYIDTQATFSAQALTLYVDGATSGLAQNLVCNGNETTNLRDHITGTISVNGTINNLNGIAGGIFGKIENKGNAQLVISSAFTNAVTCLGITSVSGQTAGRMFGEVYGNVSIEASATQISNSCTVTGIGNDGTTVGQLIGKIDGTGNDKAKINVTNIKSSVTGNLNYNVSNAQIAGGLIGSINNADITLGVEVSGTSNSASMKNTINTINGNELACYAGGLIGKATNSSIILNGNTDDATLNATMTIKVLNSNDSKEESAAGGIVGFMADTSFTSNLKIEITIGSGTSAAKGDYVGGLFGYMSNGTFTSTKDIKYTTTAKGKYVGGFAGYMDSMECNIAGTVTANSKLNGNYAGGFAGNATRTLADGEKLDSKNFKAENIIFATTIATDDAYTGIATGGLFGNTSNQYFDVKSVSLNGELVLDNSAQYSGGIFGYDEGSKIIEDMEHKYVLKDQKINVISSNTNTSLGGFAGYLKNTTFSQSKVQNSFGASDFAIDISWDTVLIKAGNESADNQFIGGVIGTYYADKDVTSNLIRTSVYSMQLNATSKKSDEVYSGVIIGQVLEADNCTFNLTIDGAASQNLLITDEGINECFGGIVGFNQATNLIIKNSFVNLNGQSNGKKIGKIKLMGGYIGKTVGNATVKDCTVQVNGNKDFMPITFGGVVGQIGTENQNATVVVDGFGYKNKYNQANTVLDSDVDNEDAIWGGVAGCINRGSVLELNGNINQSQLSVSNKDVKYKYFGTIVGYQNNALAYINPTSYSSTAGYTYGFTTISECPRDEIGNYGSVYRNGNLDSDSPSTGLDDKSNWVIKRNEYNASIREDSNPYTLATAGDIMRLSIALNTEDNFTGFKDVKSEALLSEDKTYTVTKNIDISKTGIMSINKNDISDSTKDYSFKGTVKGDDGVTNPTITHSITALYQPNVGLFSTVDGATFTNLGVNMTVSYPYASTTSVSMELIGDKQNAGGLAAIAKGNVTVNNVDIDVTMSENEYPMGNVNDDPTNNHDFDNHCYGGAFGKYTYSTGNTLNFNNVKTNMSFELAETAHMFGGLVGYADIFALKTKDAASLNLNDITVSGTLTSKFADGKPNNNQETVDKMRFGGTIAQIGDDSGNTVTGYLKVSIGGNNGITVNGMQISDVVATSNNNRSNVADFGGFIGYRWNNVNADVRNVLVANATNTFTTTNRTRGASYGGLWNTVCGYMCIRQTTINSLNANIQNAQKTNKNGLLIGDGTSLYLDMGKDYETNTTNILKSGISYDIAGVNIDNDSGAESFDEIVGHNKAYETDRQKVQALTTDEMYGGIVSINGYDNAHNYHLYMNRWLKQNNGNTRYFYDLYSTLKENDIYTDANKLSNNKNVEINTSSRMMQWMLAHYASANLRQFFNIDSGYACKNEVVTFTNDIDLSNASYYPVNTSGGRYDGNEKTITLHGADFDIYVNTTSGAANAESDRIKYIKRSYSENYMLHGGIFNKVLEASISNIQLAGTITSRESGAENYSGALVAGEIVGVLTKEGTPNTYEATPTTISNIILNGISVSNVATGDSKWNGNYGLLIAKISSGATVNIGSNGAAKDSADEDLSTKGSNSTKGITMSGYNDTYTSTNKVASSLIGRVGGPLEEGINITFFNMNIPDENSNNPLAKSLFIYSYNYRYDNSGVIYIFYKKDYLKDNDGDNVTLGYEIANTVEFYNPALSTPIANYEESEIGYKYIQDSYMRYIYTTEKAISVNPKTGDIIEGHGTYDDPYVIDSPTQLITLFKYLQDHNQNKGYLNGWAVNGYGKDVVNSDKKSVVQQRNGNDKHYYNISTSSYDNLISSGFPSVENLSNAYYVITKDIDLSSAEYSGLGTENIPFTGVFIGRKLDAQGNEVNEKCVINMPKTTAEGETDYGFIKYAKGAVVQNLSFSMGNDTKDIVISDIVKSNISSSGAAVIARITGGDNQINNVTVSGKIKAYNNNTTATIGAYVGYLKFGTLIIKSFENDSVKDFSISTTHGSYMNGLVGKILDGFVIDDTDDGLISEKYNNDNKLNATDTTDTVPSDSSRTFDGKKITDSIVSRKNALDTNDKITVSRDSTTGFRYTLNNTQNLMALTVALNSGAMNYYYNKTTGENANNNGNTNNGYDYYSRCRIANYDYVGKCSEGRGKEQYTSVILHDNMQNYYNDSDTTFSNPIDFSGGTTQSTTFYTPYIFQFFDFGNSKIMYGKSTDKGILNRMENDAKESWESSYTLNGGTEANPNVYDLSNYWFKKCFKGIGARYNNTSVYSLQGSFVGSGKDNTVIKYDMDISDSKYASLFTIFYTNNTNVVRTYTYGNFEIVCHVSNTKSYGVRAAAGLVSFVDGINKHNFENICISGVDGIETVTSNNETIEKNEDYRMAAGILVSPEKNNTDAPNNNNITLTNCELSNASVIAKEDCGGLIAIDEINTNKIVITSCIVKNSIVKGYSTAVGGFIGTTIAPITVKDSSVLSSNIETTYGSAGGMIGRVSKRTGGDVGKVNAQIKFDDCTIGKSEESATNTKVSSLYSGAISYVQEGYHTGGFVGNLNVDSKKDSNNKEIEWYDVPFNNCNIDGLEINVNSSNSFAGGFVGRSYHGMYVNNTNNPNQPIRNDSKKTVIKNLIINKTNPTYKDDAVGGMIGFGTSLNFANVYVVNMKINAKNVEDVGGIIGVANEWNMTLDNVNLGKSYDENETNTNVIIDGGAESNPGNNQLINVGGFVGRYERGGGFNHNRFINCSIGNGIGNVVIENGTNVGGVYGTFKSLGISASSGYFCGTNNFKIDNATIISKTFGTNTGCVAYAGGIVGKIDYNSTGNPYKVYNTKINNLTIKTSSSESDGNTTIYASSIGGVAGFTNKNIDVKRFKLSNSNLGTDGYALYVGGIVGKTNDNGLVSIRKSETVANEISNSTIQGAVSGGIIGINQATKQSDLNDVSIDNTTVIAKRKNYNNDSLCAGGLVGVYETNTPISGSNITVNESVVTAYNYYQDKLNEEFIGGLIGRITRKTIDSKLYNITLDNELIGFVKNGENNKDLIPTYKDVTKETNPVLLYATHMKDSGEKEQIEIKSNDTMNATYAYNRGMFVGTNTENSQMKIIRTNVHYDDINKKYYPTSDIGASDNQVWNSKNSNQPMKSIYDLYRPNIKIIYRDIQDTKNTDLNMNSIIPTALKAGGDSISDYYFADLDRVLSDNSGIIDNGYTYGTNINNSNYRLEENYGYSDVKIKDVIEKTYKKSDGTYLSPFKNGTESIPMITVTNNDYSLTSIMNTVLNVLTNNGGGTESVKDIASVDFIRMKVENGNVTKAASNSESDQVLEYNAEDGTFSIKSAMYDTTEDNSGTFTVCKVNYKYDDNNAYSIYIPVCIKELIGVQSHLRGLGGSYYKYGDSINVKENNKDATPDNISVEQKNTYTLYAEFSYNKIRKNYKSGVDLYKTLYQTTANGNGAADFDVGTRITLIDVDNGNKVYYYTVGKSGESSINFTEFKDANDNQYITKNINAIDSEGNDLYAAKSGEKDICIGNNYTAGDDAVERFIIVIDKSQTNPTVNINNRIYVRALDNEENKNIYSNITYNPECYVNVNEFPGLLNYISGSTKYNNDEQAIKKNANLKDGRNNVTLKSDSKISKDGFAGIYGSAYIVSRDVINSSQVNYWTILKDQSKYLDLGITIRDNTDKPLNIPAGTKVTVNLKVPTSDGTKKDISYSYYADGNTPYIYCFKDYVDKATGKPFNMNSLKNNGYIDYDIDLDFATATDFSAVKNMEYHANLELLGTNDARYPRSGEVFDSSIVSPIKGVTKSNLGFAVETEDMLTQGMNGYNSESSDSGLIHFKTRLDFSEFIDLTENGEKVNAQFDKYNNKFYKYSFDVQYKIKSGEYKELSTLTNKDNLIKLSDGTKALDDMLQQTAVSSFNKTSIQYSSQDLLNNKDGGIFELPFTLYADRDELLKEPSTITNYRVICTVTVYDKNPDVNYTDEEGQPQIIYTLSDYYVFTVAKIKTDME
ncbi:hypothetical protein [Eubacterium sp.]